MSQNSKSLDPKKFPNYYLAHELINEIKSDISSLRDLDELLLLDIMGIIGIQFTQGDEASKEYLAAIKESITV